MLDIVQEVIGMLAGIVGLLYLAGGVIVNLHLSRFGASEYQILKAKYLAVGLSFLISVLLFVGIVWMASVFIFPVVSIFNLQVRLTISTIFLFWFTWLYYSQRFRQFFKRLWCRVFKCVEQKAAFHFWVLAVIGVSVYPVSFMISDNWMALNIQPVGLYSTIALLYGVVGSDILKGGILSSIAALLLYLYDYKIHRYKNNFSQALAKSKNVQKLEALVFEIHSEERLQPKQPFVFHEFLFKIQGR
jgi:hypothetical protein